jgi:hypothetical protein
LFSFCSYLILQIENGRDEVLATAAKYQIARAAW